MNEQLYDRATALVVVDVQNDFADPAGALAVSGAEAVVAVVAAEVEAATRAGALVAYTTDWHPQHTPHFVPDGGPWPVHCVAGTWGAELHPGIPRDGIVVRKGEGQDDGYSGMNVRAADGSVRPTALPGILEERQVKRVVVVGLATDYCVSATAVDLAASGYETTVLERAIAAVELEPGDGERAVARMVDAGVRVERVDAA
jgi:nicotinamidase/pyrazinamidase